MKGITSFAVVPGNPRWLYVTNRDVLLASKDGGCTWQQIYALPLLPSAELPRSRRTYDYIAAISLRQAGAPRAEPVIYLTIGNSNEVYPQHRYTLWRSTDGGSTWEPAGPSTTTGGDLPMLLIPDPNGELAYLGLRRSHPSKLGVNILRTTDGGDSWTEMTEAVPEVMSGVQASVANGVKNAANRTYGFTVDPSDNEVLWVWDALRVRVSSNGGKTWAEVSPPKGVEIIQEVEVSHPKGSDVRLWLLATTCETCSPITRGAESGGPQIYFSDDRGESWLRATLPILGQPLAAETGATSGELIAYVEDESSGPHVYSFEGSLYKKGIIPWVEITPPGMPQGFRAITTVVKRGRIYYLLATNTSIEIYRP